MCIHPFFLRFLGWGVLERESHHITQTGTRTIIAQSPHSFAHRKKRKKWWEWQCVWTYSTGDILYDGIWTATVSYNCAFRRDTKIDQILLVFLLQVQQLPALRISKQFHSFHLRSRAFPATATLKTEHWARVLHHNVIHTYDNNKLVGPSNNFTILILQQCSACSLWPDLHEVDSKTIKRPLHGALITSLGDTNIWKKQC